MLIPTPKNCDVSVKKAIQLLSSKLDYSAEPIFGALTLSKTCTLAAGANILRVTGLQTDNIAMTGTLRGAYIDVSNGSLAATGTIRAMELKARTEAPGDTGNDVAVLEGLSISADSKAHSVTTMRAAEFILDGKTAGTIDEAVGLRIANNLQVDKATVSYGLQIYCDSFAYTADIQLSNDATIGISTSGAHLKMNPSGSLGICLPAGTEANERLTIGSNDESELLNIWHSNSHASYRTSKGNHRFQTDEGVNTHCHLSVFGKGTGVGYLNLYDEDSAESLEFRCSLGHAYLDVTGANPGPIHLQDQARSSVRLFANASEGETKELMIYGRRTGDIRRILEIGVGVDADDTASFDGVSNYLFDGAGIFTGLTITGNSVLGLNSAVFQPATDSTTFFQVLDADGGTPIFNVDTTNERVGVGTNAPNAPLEVKGAKPGVVGGHQSGQLQVTGDGAEFYCAVITGHNAFNGNTQLWYLGNTSSSSHNDIAFINRQNAPIHFYTNNTSRMTISAAGTITGLSTAAFEGASVTVGKASTTTGTLILHDSNSANTITLTVPDISAGSLSFTLPPTDGDNLDVLQTNGSGVLTWVAPGGAFTSRCSVWRNAAQSVPNITWTKILLNTEDYDIDGEFDSTTNYRFQPDVTGYYHVNVSANTASLNAGKIMYVAIHKNNSVWKEEVLMNGTSGVFTGITGVACDMYLLDTDYIELWVYHNHGSAINVGTGVVRFTYMDVHRFA